MLKERTKSCFPSVIRFLLLQLKALLAVNLARAAIASSEFAKVGKCWHTK